MTSVLWGIGDLFAQEIEGHRADPLRAAVTAAYGATLVGPTGHVWYLWLDRFAAKHFLPGSSSFILAKILADGLAFGPVHVGTYFAFMTLLEGGSLQARSTARVPELAARRPGANARRVNLASTAGRGDEAEEGLHVLVPHGARHLAPHPAVQLPLRSRETPADGCQHRLSA